MRPPPWRQSSYFAGSGERPNLGGDLRIFRNRRVGIAEFDIGGLDTRPFGRGAEKPALVADDPRGVEPAARNEELNFVAPADVRADDVKLRRAIVSTSIGSPR